VGESNYRMKGESQEHYCQSCLIYRDGFCNVILRDAEECGDKIAVEPPIPGGYCQDADFYGYRD